METQKNFEEKQDSRAMNNEMFESLRVLRSLGRGAFGEVYLAKLDLTGKSDDTHCAEFIALKRSPLAQLSDNAKKQALDEAAFCKELGQQNNNILACFGYRYHTDLKTQWLELILEFAPLGDLSRRIHIQKEYVDRQSSGLPEAEIADYSYCIADALAYLHSLEPKVLHRDVKPANILLFPGNGGLVPHAKLADFGIAKAIEADSSLAGTIVGTPHYLSPEMCRGQDYDERADAWALGVALYEMLCLQRPFHAVEKHLPVLALRISEGRYDRKALRFLDAEYDSLLLDAVEGLLCVEMKRRYRASDVMPLLSSLLAQEISDSSRDSLIWWQKRLRSINGVDAQSSSDPSGAFTDTWEGASILKTSSKWNISDAQSSLYNSAKDSLPDTWLAAEKVVKAGLEDDGVTRDESSEEDYEDEDDEEDEDEDEDEVCREYEDDQINVGRSDSTMDMDRLAANIVAQAAEDGPMAIEVDKERMATTKEAVEAAAAGAEKEQADGRRAAAAVAKSAADELTVTGKEALDAVAATEKAAVEAAAARAEEERIEQLKRLEAEQKRLARSEEQCMENLKRLEAEQERLEMEEEAAKAAAAKSEEERKERLERLAVVQKRLATEAETSEAAAVRTEVECMEEQRSVVEEERSAEKEEPAALRAEVERMEELKRLASEEERAAKEKAAVEVARAKEASMEELRLAAEEERLGKEKEAAALRAEVERMEELKRLASEEERAAKEKAAVEAAAARAEVERMEDLKRRAAEEERLAKVNEAVAIRAEKERMEELKRLASEEERAAKEKAAVEAAAARAEVERMEDLKRRAAEEGRSVKGKEAVETAAARAGARAEEECMPARKKIAVEGARILKSADSEAEEMLIVSEEEELVVLELVPAAPAGTELVTSSRERSEEQSIAESAEISVSCQAEVQLDGLEAVNAVKADSLQKKERKKAKGESDGKSGKKKREKKKKEKKETVGAALGLKPDRKPKRFVANALARVEEGVAGDLGISSAACIAPPSSSLNVPQLDEPPVLAPASALKASVLQEGATSSKSTTPPGRMMQQQGSAGCAFMRPLHLWGPCSEMPSEPAVIICRSQLSLLKFSAESELQSDWMRVDFDEAEDLSETMRSEDCSNDQGRAAAMLGTDSCTNADRAVATASRKNRKSFNLRYLYASIARKLSSNHKRDLVSMF